MSQRQRALQLSRASKPTIEGAGVHLRRAFGFPHLPELDPFLLLDEFHSENPADYESGFPWHPHRGIETITYVLQGEVAHGDSLGNRGTIAAGDVQWMTAGGGIIHQEMPHGDGNGAMWGFQLWANLPARHKMMGPRYQEVKAAQLPTLMLDSGVQIKVICGEVAGTKGPIQNIIIEPTYLDVTVPRDTIFTQAVDEGQTAFAYLYDGRCRVGGSAAEYGPQSLLLFAPEGKELVISTQDQKARCLLVAGRPIREPVAWSGPIVMNTEEELQRAFEDYRRGTFLEQNH